MCIHIYIYIMYILYIYIYIFTSTHTFYLQQYPHFVEPWALAAGQGPRCFAMGTARVKKAPATPKRRKSSEAAKVKAKRPAASPQTGPQDADGGGWIPVAWKNVVIPIGSMVLLYMVTFTINIPPNVSMYTIHGSYGICCEM